VVISSEWRLVWEQEERRWLDGALLPQPLAEIFQVIKPKVLLFY
jgi:hypothetical protein